jgi:glycosyltransferase involved in cell wall biosynthesis
MTRVAISLATLAPGRVGGSERYVRELLRASAAEPRGPELLVLAPPAVREAFAPVAGGRVSLVALPHSVPASGPQRGLTLLAELAAGRALGQRVPPVDVVHHPLTVPVVRPRAPSAVTLHDLAHHELPELFAAPERAFRRVAYDAAARRAALVITPSQHAHAVIAARLGIDPARIEVIPHGIDHGRFAPEREPGDAELLALLALPARYVLYPANLWPHKNHERLLQALGRVREQGVTLVLTGRGLGRHRRFDELAAQAGVAGRVRHLGHLPEEMLPALYRGAEAVVFPSLHEGFGQPVLEAMACGVPVACSNVGAIAEVAAGAASTFDPYDVDAIAEALDRVVGNKDLRDRLRIEGPRRAAAFSWSESARAHHRVYARLALG